MMRAVAAVLGVVLYAATALAQGHIGGFGIQSPDPGCVTEMTAGGTGDAIVIPALPCLPKKTLLVLSITAPNSTATPTLAYQGVHPAQPILAATGAALTAGVLIPGSRALLTNDGANWYLQPIAAGGGSGGSGSVMNVFVSGSPCLTATPDPITISGTIAIQVPLSVSCGGTGDTSLLVHSPLLGEGITGVAAASVGVAGRYLRDFGSTADAAFSPILIGDLPPGLGTVTSVGLTEPVEFIVSGSPVTTAGVLAVAKANETANTVWAGPSAGGAAPPTFRPLVAGDLPGGLPTGTVTSVGLSEPVEFTVSGSPITASGTLAVAKANENANTVWAGPSTGSPAPPTFRTLGVNDLPGGLGTVTSVGASGSPCLTASPNPITTAGTISIQVPLTVPCGGTGDTTLAAHSPLLGEGTSAVTAAAVGTAGRYLRDNGASVDASFLAISLGDLPTLTCAVLPAGGCPFDTAMNWPGVPPNSAIVRKLVERNVSCPTGFTGSGGIAKTGATALTVVTINQVSSGVTTARGTFTWAASGGANQTASVASGAGMTLVAGDVIEFAFPATADVTLGDIAITLACART